MRKSRLYNVPTAPQGAGGLRLRLPPAYYRFSHALFQQYLYRSLSEGERALLHAEIAVILEDLYQGQLEEAAVVLAHHSAQAYDRDRALRYLALAGDVALRSYANQEAEGYYRQALALQPPETMAADLFSSLGEALARQNRFQEARTAWQESINCYGKQDVLDSLAWLYARLAWSARQENASREQLELCLEGLARAGEAPDGPGLARLLHETARAYADQARSAEAAPYAQRALEMAERMEDVEAQAQTLAALNAPETASVSDKAAIAARAVELAEANGLLLAAQHAHRDLAAAQASLGDYPAARDHCLRGAELARQAGSTATQSRILAFLVHLAAFFGDLDEAEKALSQAQRLLQDLGGPTRAETRVLLEEIWYLGHRGEWQTCVEKAQSLQISLRERRAERDLAEAVLTTGWVILESRSLGDVAYAGSWQEAESALKEAAEIFGRSSSPQWGTYARVMLGNLYVCQGRFADARQKLAEAREGDRHHPLFWLVGPRQWLEGRLTSAAGHWAKAIDRYEAACSTHEDNGARWWGARVHLDWAEAQASRGEAGDRQRAAELLREAQEAFQDMGVERYAAIAEERLQELGKAGA